MSFVASANPVLSDRGTRTSKHRGRSRGSLGVMIHFGNARLNTSLLFSRLTQSGWLYRLNLVFAVNNKLLVHPVITHLAGACQSSSQGPTTVLLPYRAAMAVR